MAYNCVRYAAVYWGRLHGLDQNGGYVEAIDLKSGKRLWFLRVYKIDYDNCEKDVQNIFITKFAIEHGRLVVTNEKNEKFTVDLKTEAVARTN